MKVVFDINVLVDVASRWHEFPDSLRLYDRLSQDPRHEGAFGGCGYTTLYYILNQVIPEPKARAFLDRFRQTLKVLPFRETTASAAARLAMADLEDACLAASAMEGKYEVIATRNLADFAASPIPARSPSALLKLL